MTLLSRLAFLLHALVAIPIAIDPQMAFFQLQERPKLIYFAMQVHADRQSQVLHMYERLAVAFQIFIGLSGLFVSVDNWYMPFALMVYDVLNVLAIQQYLETKPEFTQHLDTIMFAFGAGAVIGFVGFIWRIFRRGLSFKRLESRDPSVVHFQNFVAPLTFLYELFLCFPYDVNVLGISSRPFQNSMKDEGKMLLEFNCHRLLAGIIGMFIICLGTFRVRNLNIYAPHAILHGLVGWAYLSVLAYNPQRNSGGTFEIPAFLHFGCSVGNALAYTRIYRKKTFEILQEASQSKEDRPKQE